MRKANPTDIFSVKKANVFSTEDDEFLLDLYSPIITLKNISIYFALRNEIGKQSKELSSFYLKYQVSEGEFSNALEALEAVGLIKTYYLEKTDSSSFIFCVSSPRSAGEFLSNELLAGTLLNYTSKEYVSSLVEKYSSPNDQEGHKDVSQKFMDYFQLNNEKGIYESINASLLTRKPSKISLSFNRKEFIEKINENSSINLKEDAFSNTEYVKLARLAALYGYGEEMMASLLNSSSSIFNPPSIYDEKTYNNRINFYMLEKSCKDHESMTYTHKQAGRKSEVAGSGGIQDIIRECDRLTSKEFLKKLQKGGEPARADEKLVNKLVVDMGLPQNVTNALIFYVLKVKGDKVLSPNYIEKLAATLVREDVETAIDAINCLGKTNAELREKKNSYQKKSKTYNAKKKPIEEKESNKFEEIKPEEITSSSNEEEIEDDEKDFMEFLKTV